MRQNKLISRAMFNTVTMVPNNTRRMVVERELTYCPITFLLEVRYTWVKTVIGSCTLSSICERISPLNGSPIRKMMSKAGTNERMTPSLECKSL